MSFGVTFESIDQSIDYIRIDFGFVTLDVYQNIKVLEFFTLCKFCNSIGSARKLRIGLLNLATKLMHFTYNILISACGTSKQPKQALELLQALQRQGVVPTVISYNSVICACEKGKHPQQALQAFQAMQH